MELTTQEIADSVGVPLNTVRITALRVFPKNEVVYDEDRKTFLFTEEQADELVKMFGGKKERPLLGNDKPLEVSEEKWYTIGQLAELSGLSVETLKHGEKNLSAILTQMSININVNTRLGGYHNTQKFYSASVLKALQMYLIKNGTSNAMKNKELVQENIVKSVSELTYEATVEQIKAGFDAKFAMLFDATKEMMARDIKIGMQSEYIEKSKPLVDGYKLTMDSDGTYSMAETAKLLKLGYGNRTLFAKLRDIGILDRNNIPLQEFVNRGYFMVITKPIPMGESTENKLVTRVTAKDVDYIAKKLGAIREVA